MKKAASYLVGETVHIQALSLTTEGVWIADGAVHSPSLTDPEATARAIRAALRQSSAGIPHPAQTQWKSIQQPLLAATGSRSWAALARKSRGVGIESEAGSVTFTPIADHANQGGTAVTDGVLSADVDASDLGETLMIAYRRSS